VLERYFGSFRRRHGQGSTKRRPNTRMRLSQRALWELLPTCRRIAIFRLAGLGHLGLTERESSVSHRGERDLGSRGTRSHFLHNTNRGQLKRPSAVICEGTVRVCVSQNSPSKKTKEFSPHAEGHTTHYSREGPWLEKLVALENCERRGRDKSSD